MSKNKPLGERGITIVTRLLIIYHHIVSHFRKYNNLLRNSIRSLFLPEPSQPLDQAPRHTGSVFLWYDFLSDHQKGLGVLVC